MVMDSYVKDAVVNQYPKALLAVSSLLFSGSLLASTLTPAQVFAATQQYNGQKISVQGTITNPKAGISQDGKPYQSFQLCDVNTCLNVYTRDTNTYTAGTQQTLTGHFWAVRHIGYKTHYNELVLPSKVDSTVGTQ